MSTHLRVPVTDEQKKIIMDAIADEPNGFAAWAREVLLQAARGRLAGSKPPLAQSASRRNRTPSRGK